MAMFQYFKKSKSKMGRSLQIGLVSGNPTTRNSINEIIMGDGGVAVQVIDPARITSKAAGVGVNVFVYDLDTASEPALVAFNTFMQQRPGDTPVIVLAEGINDELVRWLLQLRVADWVKVPFSAGELIAACGRALGQSKSAKSDVKCYAFMGAKGGVGTTTIAVHAALALAAKSKSKQSTCLVDLDFLNSSCADFLDLQPQWAIGDLVGDPGRLDQHMFDSLLVPHKSGISVLSAQRKFGETREFPEEVITRPLDFALQKFSNLVIDMPRTADHWAENVIQGASDLFIVTEFTVPGLKASRRLVNQLIEQFGQDTRPKVIVNRYARDFFGSNLAATEAKELLGPFLAGFVPKEEKLVSEAVNRGIPTTDIKSRNSIYKEIAKIIGVA